MPLPPRIISAGESSPFENQRRANGLPLRGAFARFARKARAQQAPFALIHCLQ
jgi:hypothetical protein